MKIKLLPVLCILSVGILIASCGLQPDQPETPPVAPSLLSVEAISWCSVLIQWQDNSSNESGFIISRSLSSAFNTFDEITVDPNITSYIDRSVLSPSTTYYYRVRAFNSVGDSIDSSSQHVITKSEPALSTDSLVADHSVIDWIRLGNLPVNRINDAKAALHIGYGHTSHGSQIVSGMSDLIAFAYGSGCNGSYTGQSNLFSWNHGGTGGALDLQEGDGYGTGDLDHDAGYIASDWETNGHHSNWYRETRQYLDNPDNAEINVIMWSWCGQVSRYSEEEMTDNYLSLMNQLETDYPDVTFIYMTGHLNGTGTDGNLHQRNEQIRQYCLDNNKWLFDFADIESYDPDGLTNYNALNGNDACYWDTNNSGETYHPEDPDPDETDDECWATEWQNSHTEDEDWYQCYSAHSQALNANMKAYAAWWLWARLAGWNGT